MNDPILYEINTRCWLGELSARTGQCVHLGNVPEAEFDAWEALGFSHIWLMGVWTVGPRVRRHALRPSSSAAYGAALPDWCEADVAGSPYAIADYRIPGSLGGSAGLREFRKRLQTRGLKLILDFVPNHVGLDHAWLRSRPDYFVQSPSLVAETFRQQTGEGVRHIAHGKDPFFPAWSDTAQLDYRRTATRAAMIQVLGSIADLCDGVRCDMAMLLLNQVFNQTWKHLPCGGAPPSDEFWAEAIHSIKQSKPDFLFVAEAYWNLEDSLRALGFDFAYNKLVYDDILERQPARLHRRLLSTGKRSLQKSVHFLENHDEPRIASLLSLAEHRAAAWLILSLPGMCLLHEGQLTGAQTRSPVQLVRRLAESEHVEISRLYQQLLAAVRQSHLRQGGPILLPTRAVAAGDLTAENLVAVLWRDPRLTSAAFDLAVTNLAAEPGRCQVSLGRGSLESALPELWEIIDLLEPHRPVAVKSGQDLAEFPLELEAHGIQLLRFIPASRNVERA